MPKTFSYKSPKTGKEYSFDWTKNTDPTPDDFKQLQSHVDSLEVAPTVETKPDNSILGTVKKYGGQVVDRAKGMADTYMDQVLGPLGKNYDFNKASEQGTEQLKNLRDKPIRTLANTVVPIDSTIDDIKKGNYGGAAVNVGTTALAGYGLAKGIRGLKPTAIAEAAADVKPTLKSGDLLGDAIDLKPKPKPSWDFENDLKSSPDPYNPTRSKGIQNIQAPTTFGKNRKGNFVEKKNPLAGIDTNRDYLTDKGNIFSTVPNRIRPEAPNVTLLKTLSEGAPKVGSAPPKAKVEFPSAEDNANFFEGRKPKPTESSRPSVDSIIAKKAAKNPIVQDPTILKAISTKVKNSSWAKLFNDVSQSGESELNSLGDAGKQLAKLLKDTDTEASRYGGESALPTRLATRNLSHAEQTEVVKIMDGQISVDKASSPKVAEAYKSLRQSTESLGNEAVNSKLSMKAGDKTIPFQKHEGEYFPHQYPDDLFKNPTDLKNRLLQSGKSVADADLIVKNITEKGEKFLPSQHARTLDIPGYKEDLPTLEKYQYDMARRITQAKRLGPGDLGDNTSPVMQLINKTSDPERAGQIVKDYLGRNEKGPTYRQDVANKVTKAEVASHLSQFAITNLGDFASGASQFGPGKLLRAMKDVVTDPHGSADIATQSGAHAILRREVLKDVQSGELLSKAYGMAPVEKAIRTVHSLAARATVQDLFNKAKTGDASAKSNLAAFVDGSVDDVLGQDKLTDKQIDFAGGRGTEMTSGVPSRLNLSKAFYAQNPVARLPMLFKRFAFVNAKNMTDAVSRQPTIAGKMAKAGTILAAYQLAGEGTGDAKAAIKGLISGDVENHIRNRGDFVGTGNDALDRILANYLQVGLFGILGDVSEGAVRGTRNLVTGTIGGPVGSDLDELASDFQSKDKLNAFGKSVTKRIPFIGGGLAERYFGKAEKKQVSPFR